MNKQYHQLTQELRYQISASRKTGMTLRQIAEEVGVHFSTVCRELKRNITSLNYDPKMAHTLSCKRKMTSKKACKRQPSTDEIIRKCMVLNWSPGAICDRMPREFAPSECLSDAMIALLGQVHTALTITLDNGGEFAGHMKVHEATGAKVYFAKPYASWQRGTNENTNGRIRRFWPKKFDMARLTEEEIENRILQLNLTPRKILGGLTPLEVFTGKRVALIA
ncbi:IS30 family transposase [Shewanella benthica]|uniref:Integrase catalytic domain-containing protein n=1 Tax=Shewanella benthica KT99 TaxID=314608 RepID=A9DI66_9GAMM|nr:IS30 family transposase [Shewanella benthica]EDP99107.1 hypothetical protein KT99_12064 [Shewanella benthica KT99]